MKQLMILSALSFNCAVRWWRKVKSADLGGVDAIMAQLNKQLASGSLKTSLKESMR